MSMMRVPVFGFLRRGGDEVDLRLSKAEVQIFWTGLVASPVIWVRINF